MNFNEQGAPAPAYKFRQEMTHFALHEYKAKRYLLSSSTVSHLYENFGVVFDAQFATNRST